MKIWILIADNLRILGPFLYYPLAYEELQKWNKDPENISDQAHLEEYEINQGISKIDYRRDLWKKGLIKVQDITGNK